MLHYWLKLSCHKEADPELISLHLTDFRAVSPQLLEFIINMADANGNTALHYTVSHSNFPLVAKLLETGRWGQKKGREPFVRIVHLNEQQ